ncbi:MAG: hypothetical protein PHQ27_00670, partial [Victivallales bacterium]|nr:hypothetical protein [Victivallales bacterium]
AMNPDAYNRSAQFSLTAAMRRIFFILLPSLLLPPEKFIIAANREKTNRGRSLRSGKKRKSVCKSATTGYCLPMMTSRKGMTVKL